MLKIILTVMYDFEGIQRTGCITTENEQRRSEEKKKVKSLKGFCSVSFSHFQESLSLSVNV